MASTSNPDPDDDLVTAVGRYVLGEISLARAAEVAGLTRWEFEQRLREADVTALYGPRTQTALDEEVEAARDIDE